MRKVLVVDDSRMGRELLARILSNEYEVLEAESGKEMLGVLNDSGMAISAIVLDIVMPEMDGYEALRRIRENALWRHIPVIMSTSLSDESSQIRALELGANGFASKPYQPELIIYALQNAIELHEKSSLLNTMRRDSLTGLFNRETFFSQAKQMIDRRESGYYVLSSLNIENFSVINDMYGTDKGDEVLQHVASVISRRLNYIDGICCRIWADRFGILYPQEYLNSPVMSEIHSEATNPSCIDQKIRLRIGRIIIDDTSLPVSSIYDRASMAAESIKGRYDTYIAAYDHAMRDKRLREQTIINEMGDALAAGEFEAWFQPQYNHATGAMVGAEALVRWRKNDRLVPPIEFIPVFERNGFIFQMDQYIWRQVCSLLRRWLDEGRNPLPISVNVSRHDLFQPDFISVLCSLVQEYELPVELLRIEVTESAFADSQETVISTVKALIDFGFTVEIDDFGSGYSSLNTLKDVPAGILKLDMKFLGKSNDANRSGSILESVVRMAKWIGMSVIAEGVEDQAQADYLKSIGCHYLQGYYYAKPMCRNDYEVLLEKSRTEPKLSGMETVDTLDRNAFWNPKSMETLIFNSYVGGAAIIEYYNGTTERIRSNDRFAHEFGGATINGKPVSDITPEECLDEENIRIMYEGMDRAVSSKVETSYEIVVDGLDSKNVPSLYLRCTIRMIAWTNDRSLLYCVIHNVTAQRAAEKRERELSVEILDNLPCGAGLYEFDGAELRAIHLNMQYWEQVGRSRNELIGSEVLELVHEDDRARILPEISDAIMQKRDAILNIRMNYGENGEYRKFHVMVQIIKRESIYSLYAVFIPATDDSLLLEVQNKSKQYRERLDFIFKNAAISVWSYNIKTGELIQNDRSRQLHGFDSVVSGVPESLIDCGFVHPDSADEYLAMYQRLKSGATEAEGIFRVQKADRTGYWLEHVRYAAISYGDDESELIFGISNDVTAEHEQDSAIRQWMEVISEMQVENSSICEYNLTQNVFVRMQGSLFPPFEFEKIDDFDNYIRSWARSSVYSDDVEKIIDFLNRDNLLILHERGVLDGGIDYRAIIGGSIRWCSLSIKFINYANDEDVRLIMVHSDIDARKQDELRLIEENRRDPLTGVLNRKAFERQVNKILLSMPDSTHAMFMIDLDNFKDINDKFGHVIGDHVLIRTAEDINSMLLPDDFVGRIGGDEFMVFLKNIPSRELINQRAQNILDLMHASLKLNVEVSVSLGVAIAPRDGSSFEDLYRSADRAVYYSKQHGKNRATFFEDDFEHDSTYGGTISQIDFDNDPSTKAWSERTKMIIEENRRLLERQEEDERYRIIFENTHVVTFEWNAMNGKFTASPDFYEYVLSEQSGERLFSENIDVSGIHPADRTMFYGRFLEQVLSGEPTAEISLRLLLKAGGSRWCRLSAIVFFDKAERLTKAIGVIASENIAADISDIRFPEVMKYLPAGIMLLEIKDSSISTLYVSESYRILDGDNAPERKTVDPLYNLHPDDLARLRQKLLISAVSGAVMEDTFRVLNEGRMTRRRIRAVRIPYPNAAEMVMVLVEMDMTERQTEAPSPAVCFEEREE